MLWIQFDFRTTFLNGILLSVVHLILILLMAGTMEG